MRVAINARVTAFALGGQQRVAEEILGRLDDVEPIAPSRPLGGLSGHLWEQFVLPARTTGRLLWSPSATGPVVKTDQVVTLHDIAFYDVPEFFSRSFRSFYGAISPLLVRRAACVVTVSEFSRRRIVERLRVPEDKIVVIGNGVSPGFRSHSPEEIDATRAALDLPPRYVLLQATSDRRKNLARAVAAWTAVLPNLPEDLHLVVSGNFGRSHVFGEADDISGSPRTRLLGYVAEEHMGPLLSGAAFFLFPSLYEGFGLPIIEAMSCDTPVLTSDATATKEIAGNAALLVDPTSIDSIGEGILRLAMDDDLRRRLVHEGRRRASAFTWDDAASRYQALFARLIEQRTGPMIRAVR